MIDDGGGDDGKGLPPWSVFLMLAVGAGCWHGRGDVNE